MPIYKNRKLINIAIPKTSCTSIYNSFKDEYNKLEDFKIIILDNRPKRLVI